MRLFSPLKMIAKLPCLLTLEATVGYETCENILLIIGCVVSAVVPYEVGNTVHFVHHTGNTVLTKNRK
jgi:hypothetical protein